MTTMPRRQNAWIACFNPINNNNFNQHQGLHGVSVQPIQTSMVLGDLTVLCHPYDGTVPV
jgi:hypothetical protein